MRTLAFVVGDWTVQAGDIPTMVAAAAALGALVVAYLQVRRAIATQRGNAVRQLFADLYNDEATYRTYLRIDWGMLDRHEIGNASETEYHVDKILAVFQQAGDAVRTGKLALKDLEPFRYDITRVYRSDVIRKYLAFLGDYYKQEGVRGRPYDGFQWLAERFLAGQPDIATMAPESDDGEKKRAVLGHAKDTSLSLVQAAALLLTISLGLVTATATAESFREIRRIVVSSSIVLGASILAGVLTLSAVLDLMEGTRYEDWRENLGRWLSAVQTWLFLAGMGLLIAAIYTKLF